MNPLINNYNTSELDYYIENNDENYNENIYINSNNDINGNNNIFESKNFCTSNSFLNYPLNKNTNNAEFKNSSPKIYVKPSKYIYKKNNLVNKLDNYSHSKSPKTETSFLSNNIFYSKKENKLPGIISYRNTNNKDLNNKKDYYFNDIDFINDYNITTKLNNNLLLKGINKTKIKTYVKKNKNINYNKKDNIKIIKNKISNTNNYSINKYYNYFMSNKQIPKYTCFISK